MRSPCLTGELAVSRLRRRRATVGLAVFMMLAALAYFLVPQRSEPSLTRVGRDAYLKAACDLPPEWIRLIDRGWWRSPGTAHDLIVQLPVRNYVNGNRTGHSGPYKHLQDVPLVFYGPGFVPAQGRTRARREVTLADLAPTYAEVMGFDFPKRDGKPLRGIFAEDAPAPRLIVTAVLDGGGWNALERWPEAWPNIASLIRSGVNVDGTITGSSPSVTPAIHANISTGTFPSSHGMTDVRVRKDDGSIVGSFTPKPRDLGPKVEPSLNLRSTTLADLWGSATGHRSKAGMLAYFNYPLGMLGHGAAIDGGDKDIVGIQQDLEWRTDERYFSLPDHVGGLEGPRLDIAAVDREDGRVDGKWRTHDMEKHFDGSPALARWTNRTMLSIFEEEDFGQDDVTDLFYVNYKTPDRAGHSWTLEAPEQRDAIASVDEAIGDMVRWLEDHVDERRYLLVITADHGQASQDLLDEGWDMDRNELIRDLHDALLSDDGSGDLIEAFSPTTYFLDKRTLRRNGLTPEDVASFLTTYTVADNVPEGDVPRAFTGREDERLFAAAFPGRRLDEVLTCAGK
jgi:hypothetical protein